MPKAGQEMYLKVSERWKRSEPEDILDWPVSLGASLGQSPMMEAGIYPKSQIIQNSKNKYLLNSNTLKFVRHHVHLRICFVDFLTDFTSFIMFEA